MPSSRRKPLLAALSIALLASACHGESRPAPLAASGGSEVLIRNAKLPGGAGVEIYVVDGVIQEVASQIERNAAEIVDAKDRFVVPGVIDSHVHLDYLPVGDQLVARGIAAAVDLAAPLPLRQGQAGLDLLSTGPMLAAPGGYPTRSWGQDGYGIEVHDQESVAGVITELHNQGARLVKISLGAGPDLSDALLGYAVEYAHGLGMKVAAHALSDEAAAKAAQLGADLLAHTPIEELQPQTIELWSSRAVVSTLAAFGNSPGAAKNLRALQLAGTTVLYGTDLGNSREVGISCSEVRAMQAAGMKDAELLHAMTEAPANFFGMSSLGSVTVGKKARLLLVEEDPASQAETLCKLSSVLSDRDS